jgi:signal transduction histidine kinase
MWKTFSKRCAGLATDFAYRYQYDIYFKTKVRVVGLELVLLIAIMIGLYYVLLHSLGPASLPFTVAFTKLWLLVPLEQLLFVGVSFALAVALFGYAIVHIALKPSREALASQKQFIANIAHELRTPLSVMKTNIEVALMDKYLNRSVRESLLGNVDELDRAADIINNLLSFNTLQNPEQIKFENCDLGEVAEKVAAKLSALAEEKGIQLSVTKGEFVTVWGNATALEQVVFNVTKNALLFTESAGKVAVSVLPDYRGHIEVSVSDTGIGISQHVLPHILEPFYRADSSRTRWQGGSGLGLTIVSELVKLHGGKISIKSKESEGTTIVIAVPCGQVARPGTELSDTAAVVRDYSKYNVVAPE